MRLIFLNQDAVYILRQRTRVRLGGCGSWKAFSLLFNIALPLEGDHLEREAWLWQITLPSTCPDALAPALEKPKAIFITTPGRTYNRSRSPRLEASGRWNKVGKGSRQIRSVTSGKGLALRVGHGGPRLRAAASRRRRQIALRSSLAAVCCDSFVVAEECRQPCLPSPCE